MIISLNSAENNCIDNSKIIFAERRNPIFKAQGDKNKLMEKEAPGSFSEGRGDQASYNISLLSKTNLTYSV